MVRDRIAREHMSAPAGAETLNQGSVDTPAGRMVRADANGDPSERADRHRGRLALPGGVLSGARRDLAHR